MLDVADRHPGVQHFKHHFDHDHLPPHLAAVSAPFHDLAQQLVDALPDNPELSSALRSLWDAKNSAVLVAAKSPEAIAAGRKPRRGMLVDYTLSEQDAAAINGRRKAMEGIQGMSLHTGNHVKAGDVFPMVITQTWGSAKPTDSVNGQVLLDGSDVHWATSVSQGDGERHWR